MMNNTVPGRGQYFLAAILGILAFAAGGISLAMNAQFGLKTGLVMAAIFIISDGAKIILPMVEAAMPARSLKRKFAYGVAVAISLLAATSYLLELQADQLLQNRARTTAVADARSDADQLRQSLAEIDETLSVAEIEKLAASKLAAADREAARGGCGPSCEALRSEYDALTIRLGTARRRAELENRLAAAIDKIEKAPVKALGASTTLAALTGGDADQLAQNEAIVKAIIMLVILELLATFSGEAGNLFVTTWKSRRKHAKSIRRQPEAENMNTEAPEIPSKRTGNAYWLPRLAKASPEIYARVKLGEISCYRGCIEAGIRKAAEKQKAGPKTDWTKPEAYEASDSLQIAKS